METLVHLKIKMLKSITYEDTRGTNKISGLIMNTTSELTSLQIPGGVVRRTFAKYIRANPVLSSSGISFDYLTYLTVS
jgi:hypothetical protein